ncbi:MAG: hypothetical protein E6H66_04255 [Betaproteobacteria bacterium]|nr:MAG: hypothetical protein E6H66_04255 [Betaproteobacteria bacterium]
MEAAQARRTQPEELADFLPLAKCQFDQQERGNPPIGNFVQFPRLDRGKRPDPGLDILCGLLLAEAKVGHVDLADLIADAKLRQR